MADLRILMDNQRDLYDEDESDTAFLSERPVNFAVFGPPASGKSTVARLLAQWRKCLFINPTSVVQEALRRPETTNFLNEALRSADGVYESSLLQILQNKLMAKETCHYGYVLDDFPSAGLKHCSVLEQFQMLSKLELKINFAIILRFPLEDSVRRRELIFLHGPTGILVPASYIAETTHHVEPVDQSAKVKFKSASKDLEKGATEDGEEEPETGDEHQEQRDEGHPEDGSQHAEDEEHSVVDSDVSTKGPVKATTFGHKQRRGESGKRVTQTEQQNEVEFFHQMFFPDLQLVKGKIQFPRESLFLRAEDSVEMTQESYLEYKKAFLPHLENFISSYYPIRCIEIDANEPLSKLISILSARMEVMRVQKPAVARPMRDFSELQKLLEEKPDSLEEQFKRVAHIGSFSPRWKWRKSLWEYNCPVALYEGKLVTGAIELATVFLDRVYFLSNKEAQDKFLENPRLYLLPPQPRAPLRAVILGPPRSGRSQLANQLSKTLQARVIEIGEVEKELRQQQEREAELATRKTLASQVLERIRPRKTSALKELRVKLQYMCNSYRAMQPSDPILNDVEELINEDRANFLTEVPNRPVSPLELEEVTTAGQTTDEQPADQSVPTAPVTQTFVVPSDPETLQQELRSTLTIFSEMLCELQSLSKSHNEVQAEVDTLMSSIKLELPPLDAHKYIAMLKESVRDQTSHLDPTDPDRSRWILDNVPASHEILKLLLEHSSVDRPTDVIVIKDKHEKLETLRKYRVTDGAAVTDEEWEKEVPVVQSAIAELETIEAELAKSDLRLHSLNLQGKDIAQLTELVITPVKGVFAYRVTEYDGSEDHADDDGENEDEDSQANEGDHTHSPAEENSEKTKPVCDVDPYCPVALKDKQTLWPGDAQHGSLLHKDKIYTFSTPEAKEAFSKDPESYISKNSPASAPPLRIFVTGPTGSGRTTISRTIAEKFNAVVINLRNFMIEASAPKNQKSSVETYVPERPLPYWRLPKQSLPNPETRLHADNQLQPGLIPLKLAYLSSDPSNPTPMEPFEQACHDALTSNSSLPAEFLEAKLNEWLRNGPFKNANVVFDGFPMNAEDLRTLIEHAHRPDVVVMLSMDKELLVQKVLPQRKAFMLKKRAEIKEKLARSFHNKDLEWSRKRSARKAELLKERLAARDARVKAKKDGDEKDEEEDEDPEEAIDQLLDEEMPEPKLEDERSENDEKDDDEESLERLEQELHEQVEHDMDNMEAIKEALEEGRIEHWEFDTSRPLELTKKRLHAKVAELDHSRAGLFQKAYPITHTMAIQMTEFHYKRFSRFGYCCPVKVAEGHVFPPSPNVSKESYPVVYRQHVYFCSSPEARKKFIATPEFYVNQSPPRPSLPVRVVVLGPPKSGKTSLARRLAQELGVARVSLGDALRHVYSSPDSELKRVLRLYLSTGTELPDSLEVLSLEAMLRTADCQSRGWILDGYPTTTAKLNLMLQRSIIPTVVFEVKASNKLCLFRTLLDSTNPPTSSTPAFNSAQVVATRLAHYQKSIAEIRTYFKCNMRNLVEIDGSWSKWKMWETAFQIIKQRTVSIQNYVESRESGRPAQMTHLCVTPTQLQRRLSHEYGPYCPITLNKADFLFDCIEQNTSHFVVEYSDRYYLFATEDKMREFMEEPDKWLPPSLVQFAPPPQKRANVVQLEELEPDWRARLAFQGLCPVTYYQYNYTAAGLKYGSSKWIAEYLGKLYTFRGRDELLSFIGSPKRNADLPLPVKRPPEPENINAAGDRLIVVPYLEGQVSAALVDALKELDKTRPKYPLMDHRQSALAFLATYLKSTNNSSEKHVQRSHATRLAENREIEELAKHLQLNMQTFEASTEDLMKDLLSVISTKQAYDQDAYYS